MRDIRIPGAEFEKWLREAEDLEGQIRLATRRLEEIRKRIDAVRLLDPSLDPNADPGSEEPASLMDVIVHVLRESREPLTRPQIRRRAAELGMERSDSYFYTAIGRAVKRGLLVAVGDRLKLPDGGKGNAKEK